MTLPGPTRTEREVRVRAPGKVNRAMSRVHGHGYASVPGTSHMLQIEEPEAWPIVEPSPIEEPADPAPVGPPAEERA